MRKPRSTAFNYAPRKPWFQKTEKERLEELIASEERQIDLLKNSSWMGNPPWLGRSIALDALREKLARIQNKG